MLLAPKLYKICTILSSPGSGLTLTEIKIMQTKNPLFAGELAQVKTYILSFFSNPSYFDDKIKIRQTGEIAYELVNEGSVYNLSNNDLENYKPWIESIYPRSVKRVIEKIDEKYGKGTAIAAVDIEPFGKGFFHFKWVFTISSENVVKIFEQLKAEEQNNHQTGSAVRPTLMNG